MIRTYTNVDNQKNSSSYRIKYGKTFQYGINSLKRNINTFLLFCLLFFLVFTPSDSMNLKKISFGLLILLNFNVMIKYLRKRKNGIISFFAVFFPIILVVLSTIVNNFDIVSAISNAYIMLYLLIIPVINYYKIDYEKIFIFILIMLSFVIFTSGLLDLSGVLSLSNNSLLSFFEKRSEARVGLWQPSTFGYVIFFKTSSLLIVLIGYAVAKKKYILMSISIVAMAFTGTRANLYVAILVPCIYYLIYRKTTALKFVAVIFFILIIFMNMENIINYLHNISILKEYSDLIKIEHVKSIFTLLSDNPLYIITGSGLGSYFYSTGIMCNTRLTEYAYFDLFRQIGFFNFTLFMYFLVKPIKVMFIRKENTWIGIAYIGYLAIAFTNPLLFSSTPFALYILIYLKYMDYHRNYYRKIEKNKGI